MRHALFGALLIALFGCGTARLSAQSFQLGIHAGVNVAGTPSVSSIAAEARNGIILGGSASFEISPPFRLQVEAQYVQRSLQFTNTSSSGVPTASMPSDVFNINYLEIPVNIRVGFGSTFQVYALAGTNVGTLLSASRQINHTDGMSEQVDEKGSVNSTNISLELGGGMSYQFASRLAVVIDARYAFGLNQVKDNIESQSLLSQSAWKPQDLKLTTGLIFGF